MTPWRPLCAPNWRRTRHPQPAADGTPAHSFATLTPDMATLVRNTCRMPGVGEADAPSFEVITTVTAWQQRAMALVNDFKP